ncbi:hypothetical protein [Nonomuraea roseoviolacea]|uniref:DUF4175 domain-containing protein n=1 Tax=Nonomuraea roseoviolacea subsp. carminata TaxID=160689 RepID=A0ABT1JYW8_9ACTN|nr:hypothetical protein [Nonomuraea roseoviolacea]MCP2346599.1 hypothetical protein [Nonomuraea roseoviolacea subsp. carminata]
MTGLLVGAVFGAVFVVLNAQSPLNTVAVNVLRVAACLGAAAVVAMWFATARKERPAPEAARKGMFGRGYLIVVAAEVLLLFGGLRVLAALDRPEQGNVAWVAFVVGVHFVALAPVWKDWSIAVPGAVLTVLGVAGLVMASTSAVTWVPLLSGVLSGVVLLAGSVTFGWRSLVGAS